MSTAILLIHGFLTGPDDWDELLPKLRGRYDEVSAVCQPGHARSEDKEKLNYKSFTHKASYDMLINELDRLFSAHDEVDVIGHSMGAAMAAWAAANYPVRRVCLLAPAFRFVRIGAFIKRMLYRTKRKRFKKMKVSAEYAAALSAENDRYFNDYKAGQKLLFSRLIPYWNVHTISVLYKNVKRGQKAIKNINCPVLAVWGNFDEFVPGSSIKGLSKRLTCGDMTLVNYGNLGHSMMLSLSKEIVFCDILAFLGGEAVEDVKPENPGVERTVKHVTVEDAGGEKYMRLKMLLTGSRIVGGRIELIEERSSKIREIK